MSMLICTHCGYVAEEDPINWEAEEDRAVGYASTYCPECGSDEIEVAEECECCGEHHAGGDMCVVTVEYPPTLEEQEWTEDTMSVCKECCDNYFADGRNIMFDMSTYPVDALPAIGDMFEIGLFRGRCIYIDIRPTKGIANYLMHVEEIL